MQIVPYPPLAYISNSNASKSANNSGNNVDILKRISNLEKAVFGK